MIILGIDQSSDKNGVAWTNGKHYSHSLLRLKDKGGKRLAQLEQFLMDEPADLIVMEHRISFGHSGARAGSGAVVHEVAGIIKLACFKKGVELIAPYPSQVKSWACGNGKASKPQMVEAANQQFGTSLKSTEDDIADALFLSQIGFYYLSKKSAGNTKRDLILASIKTE